MNQVASFKVHRCQIIFHTLCDLATLSTEPASLSLLMWMGCKHLQEKRKGNANEVKLNNRSLREG